MSQQDGNPTTKHAYFECGMHTAPWTKEGGACPICHRKSLKDVEEYVNTIARETELKKMGDEVIAAHEQVRHSFEEHPPSKAQLKEEIVAKRDEISKHLQEMSVPKIVVSEAKMRVFETGATRNVMGDKLEYRGFISAQARERFAQYMHHHRLQADGTIRASDNWKKGFPIASYVDSGVRHMADFELAIDAGETEKAVEIACAIWFNIQGFIHESLKASKK